MSIPSQCPECGSLSVTVTKVPPEDHEQGSGWCTHATCEDCSDYEEWTV